MFNEFHIAVFFPRRSNQQPTMTDESVEVTHIKYANGRWFAKLGDSGKHFEIVNAAKSFPNHFQQAKRDRGQWVNVEAGAKWVVSKIAFKQGAHKATYQLIYKGFEGQPYDVLDGKLAQNLRFWADEAALRPGNFVTCGGSLCGRGRPLVGIQG
jgi:hypothetical protein